MQKKKKKKKWGLLKEQQQLYLFIYLYLFIIFIELYLFIYTYLFTFPGEDTGSVSSNIHSVIPLYQNVHVGIWDTEGGNDIIPEPILLNDFEFSAGFWPFPIWKEWC